MIRQTHPELQWHYGLRNKKNDVFFKYCTELNTDVMGVWIAHFLFDGEQYIAIPFDPDRYLTVRDFKWLCAYFWRLGVMMKPMQGEDFLRNGHTSLVASTIGIEE